MPASRKAPSYSAAPFPPGHFVARQSARAADAAAACRHVCRDHRLQAAREIRSVVAEILLSGGAPAAPAREGEFESLTVQARRRLWPDRNFPGRHGDPAFRPLQGEVSRVAAAADHRGNHGAQGPPTRIPARRHRRICVSGPQVMVGYGDGGEETAATNGRRWPTHWRRRAYGRGGVCFHH